MTTEPITIRCSDGFTLRGTLHHPVPGTERGVTVIVCPAVLVRERYYARFAAHLAAQGVRAITFANRGQGRSLDRRRRSPAPRLRDWGELDLPAVIGLARSRAPTDRLYVVGHSMGGQLAGLSPSVHELAGIVTVGSTAAWWGHWPRPQRYGILAFYLAVPVAGRAMRAFPASRVGLGPDVSTHIVRTWARWGRDPDYFHGGFGIDTEMGRYAGRLLIYSFTDDEFGCRRAVDALHAPYAQAAITRRHVAPAEIGARHIGHFGYFRVGIGEPLWTETIAWIERDASGG